MLVFINIRSKLLKNLLECPHFCLSMGGASKKEHPHTSYVPAFFSCDSSSRSPPVRPYVRTSVRPSVSNQVTNLQLCHIATLQYCNIVTLQHCNQLDGPVLFIWSLGQFAYSKIGLSVCTLSQLPSPTKALFFNNGNSTELPCTLLKIIN